jgi:glycosyltransferase involved in cell wall biosynthesis
LQLLLDAGHTVTLVDTLKPKPADADRYTFLPYPGIFGLERLGLRTINRLGHWLKAAQLRLIWRRVKPDIVHVHWVDARAYQCALARLHPLILSCWGSDINNLFAPDNQDDEYRSRITRALQAAGHITADSPEVLQRCETLAGRKLNTSLFYFGIDLDRFKAGYAPEARQLRQELGIPAPARVILSVRALRPSMGHHFVLEAFSQMIKTPDLASTVLAFKRFLPFADHYEERLKDRVQEMGLERQVYWLPEVPNEQMPIHYALADLIVNYPEQDGFPVTFFEAAACQRPVVSSDLPAYRGTFASEAFRMTRASNAEALATALIDVLRMEPVELQRCVDLAYQQVSELGDQSRCLAQLEITYEQMASSRRRQTRPRAVKPIEHESRWNYR